MEQNIGLQLNKNLYILDNTNILPNPRPNNGYVFAG